MNKDYELCALQICPFEIVNGQEKLYKPMRENYPYRLCILDKSNKKAVDIQNEYQYDYIEMSIVYFLGNESKNIKENYRYAILKLDANHCLVNNSDLIKAQIIRKKLSEKHVFLDGNQISNGEYLKMLQVESEVQKQKTKKKIRNKE